MLRRVPLWVVRVMFVQNVFPPFSHFLHPLGNLATVGQAVLSQILHPGEPPDGNIWGVVARHSLHLECLVGLTHQMMG
jgi:hypothetical protein